MFLAFRPFVLTALTLGLTLSSAAESPVNDTWTYTLKRPAEGWQMPDFQAVGWTESFGGFGTPDTPGSRVGTRWQTNDIWIRKTFQWAGDTSTAALLIHHDENAQVFINGQQVASLKGFLDDYILVTLSARSIAAIKQGENTLAVHCHQNTGGQFIDAHVVNSTNVPMLPPAKRDPKPFQSDLVTTWGQDVNAENAWTEYPRPQLVRDRWSNLNGHWDYAITTSAQAAAPEQWDGKVLVPFCIESKLGGVQHLLDATETLWYRRTFDAKPSPDERTLIHFEAVDYRCDVTLNGKPIGRHRGGNDPFTFDASDAVVPGQNTIVVRVQDETEGFQLNGKQSLNPRGIWYTQVSGIWQTVWMEQVPQDSIRELDIRSDATTGIVSVSADILGDSSGKSIRVRVLDDGQVVAQTSGDSRGVSVTVPDAKLWSPSSPHLYQLEVALVAGDSAVIDQVRSYAGIRTVGKVRDSDGHLRFTLNGEVIFHWGPLDQGWWPDGLLTPPSDEAMLFDIEYLKAAGFNMIRKHIKVEPRRYYYHCDRVGMLVWQDQVSGGRRPKWTRLQPNPVDANWPAAAHDQFMLEFERMIDSLENHPSIVVWTPFNEAWGQHQTVEVGNWTIKRDPSRHVNIASGGNFWPVGDIVDHHSYPNPAFEFDPDRFGDFIKVVGEFGGHGYPTEDHLWDADRANWGYGGLPQTLAEYKRRYETSLEIMNQLRSKGVAAGVYTQTTDVEGEINGLMTYDRKSIKLSAEELAKMHARLFE